MKLLLPLLFFSLFYSRAQSFKLTDNFGFNLGVILELGTHRLGLGLKAQAYYTDYFFQINAGHSIKFNTYDIGGRKKIIQNRTNVGIALLGGKRSTTTNFILDGLNHQTNYNLGVAYNYLFYFDNQKSSQVSGGFGIHIKEFALHIENDLFGGQGRDRFRTGGIQFNYRYQLYNFKLNTFLWTGETRGSREFKRDNIIYKDLSSSIHGKFSNGIISGGIDVNLGFGQVANISAGFDSEKWRDFVQNKAIHSNTKNTKYLIAPIDEFGSPTFNRDSIRKTKLYINLGFNQELFY